MARCSSPLFLSVNKGRDEEGTEAECQSLTGMFAGETADPRGAVCEVAGGCRVVQTLQIVGGAEDRRDAGATICTVPSCVIPVPVVGSHTMVGTVGSEDGGIGISVSLTLEDQQEQDGN